MKVKYRHCAGCGFHPTAWPHLQMNRITDFAGGGINVLQAQTEDRCPAVSTAPLPDRCGVTHSRRLPVSACSHREESMFTRPVQLFHLTRVGRWEGAASSVPFIKTDILNQSEIAGLNRVQLDGKSQAMFSLPVQSVFVLGSVRCERDRSAALPLNVE